MRGYTWIIFLYSLLITSEIDYAYFQLFGRVFLYLTSKHNSIRTELGPGPFLSPEPYCSSFHSLFHYPLNPKPVVGIFILYPIIPKP